MNPQEILEKPYKRLIAPDPEGGGFTATIQEFPGCVAFGETVEQAYSNLEDTARAWISAATETRHPIVEPRNYEECSGKIALRMPRRLHVMAAEQAELEGASLNQVLNVAVATYLGQQDGLHKAVEQVQVATVALTQATKNLILTNVTFLPGNAGSLPTVVGAPARQLVASNG